MVSSYFDLLHQQIDEEAALRTAGLVRGTGSREADERVRGVLEGLFAAKEIIRAVEERARRSEE